MKREKPIKDGVPLWKSLDLIEERGKPLINADNLMRVLEHDQRLQGMIWYDRFHDKIFTTLDRTGEPNGHPSEYSDTENLHLLTYIQSHLEIPKANKLTLFDAVVAHANAHPKNEIKDWLDTLVHDERPRIDNFFPVALGSKHGQYERAVSKNFWLSMIARIYRPGCQVDNLVVLEGAQGIGKNRAWRAVGGKWYSQTMGDPKDKDFYLSLQGKLVVEFNELATVKRADAERMKACISCTVDNYRTPYERVSRDHPRQCIFVGSTNEPFYISDPSGGRRFWPIKCNESDIINIEYIEKNREQLFAEAVARFKANETWWEVPESALREQEARRVSDEWEDSIRVYSSSHTWDLTLSEIAREVMKIDIEDLDLGTQRRIGACLRIVGREKVHNDTGNVWRLTLKSKAEPSEPSGQTQVQP